MRKKLIIVILSTLSVFASVLYVSCNKAENVDGPNPCANVTCYNGGTCTNGTCSCIPGFEGAKCEINIRDKYMGNWQISEVIKGSSAPLNINKTKTYTLTVKTSDVSKLALSFNNLSNNPAYNALAYAARKYNVAGKDYLADISSNFCFVVGEPIPNTSAVINGGQGNINNLATYMSGTYYIQYPDNGKIVLDTISFSGEHE